MKKVVSSLSLVYVLVILYMIDSFKDIINQKYNVAKANFITKFVSTVGVICALGKDDRTVVGPNGRIYSISDYKIADCFKRLCLPRGVYVNDSLFAVDVRDNSFHHWKDLFDEVGEDLADKVCELLTDEFDLTKDEARRAIGEWPNQGSVAEVSLGGNDVTDFDIDSMVDDDTLTNIYENAFPLTTTNQVPLDPTEFKAYQLSLVNALRGKVTSWLNVDEITAPIFVSDVKTFGSNVSIYSSNGDYESLPIISTLINYFYSDDMFNIHIDDYIHALVVDMFSKL